MEDIKKLLKETNAFLQRFGKKNPEQMKAFMGLVQATETEGKISTKYKELISIALSIATHCKWCIAFHVESALKHGATEEEILEGGWVAVLMGGGPSLMYFQLVEKAINDFKK